MEQSSGVIFEYRGNINHLMHESLVCKAKETFEKIEPNLLIKRRMVYIIIEGLENVYKHAYHESPVNGNKVDDLLVVEDSGESYVIKIGNPVKESAVEELRERLDYITCMNDKLLQKYHNQVISTGVYDAEKEGAGLGIIRMAMKSENQIEYTLEPVNDNVWYYEIKVKVSKKLNS